MRVLQPSAVTIHVVTLAALIDLTLTPQQILRNSRGDGQWVAAGEQHAAHNGVLRVCLIGVHPRDFGFDIADG